MHELSRSERNQDTGAGGLAQDDAAGRGLGTATPCPGRSPERTRQCLRCLPAPSYSRPCFMDGRGDRAFCSL